MKMKRENINLEKLREEYRTQLEDSEKRNNLAHSFQEPDRVPIQISAMGSYYAHMFGYNIKDYYQDVNVQVDVQVRAIDWRLKNLKDDNTHTEISLDVGPIAEGLYFGCPIERPDGTSPRIVTSLKDEEDIKRLPVPVPEKCEGLKWLDRTFEEFQKVCRAKDIKVEGPGPRLQIHPPLSSACALMEPDKVYLLMAIKPEIVREFLEKMFEAFCRLMDYYDRRYGTRTESLGLANDNTCFVSNTMYVDQVLSFDRTLYEKYGKKYRSLHTDGPSDHNFKTFAEELKLNVMDIGGWSSIDAAVAAMKGKVVIHGGLNCKDVYGPLIEETKKKIRQALKVAAPGGGYEFAIGGETYVGVPSLTLIDLVNYVKEVGSYPIKL